MAEQQPKNRVLIVDDDQTLCEMYAERLKAEGYEVVVAHNGEEGAAKAVEYLPQVILLDLMMPKVNGFNTLEILKSNEETKNIPVLILTALIQEENKQRGLQAGAEGYIIKSETMPGDVIDKIKAAIEKGRQGQQQAAGGGQTAPAQASASQPSPENNQPTTNDQSSIDSQPPSNHPLTNDQPSSSPAENVPSPIGNPPVSNVPTDSNPDQTAGDQPTSNQPADNAQQSSPTDQSAGYAQSPSEPVNNQNDTDDVPKPSTPPVAPPPPPAQ